MSSINHWSKPKHVPNSCEKLTWTRASVSFVLIARCSRVETSFEGTIGYKLIFGAHKPKLTRLIIHCTYPDNDCAQTPFRARPIGLRWRWFESVAVCALTSGQVRRQTLTRRQTRASNRLRSPISIVVVLVNVEAALLLLQVRIKVNLYMICSTWNWDIVDRFMCNKSEHTSSFAQKQGTNWFEAPNRVTRIAQRAITLPTLKLGHHQNHRVMRCAYLHYVGPLQIGCKLRSDCQLTTCVVRPVSQDEHD